MEPTSIRDAVLAALGAIAPESAGERIAPDRPLRDQVELDSIDFLNFLVRLHEKFGIDVPEADAAKLVTLDDVVAYLGARLR